MNNNRRNPVRHFPVAEPLLAFDFDEEAVFDLTHGDCWFLAFLLNEKINGSVLTAIYGEHGDSDHSILHLAVQLPNSMVVDIEGIWEETTWERRWQDELEEMWNVVQDFVYPEDGDEGYLDALDNMAGRENVRYGEKVLGQIVDEIAVLVKEADITT